MCIRDRTSRAPIAKERVDCEPAGCGLEPASCRVCDLGPARGPLSWADWDLSLIHISEPTRLALI
eukprot:14006794-Alexandrium_andersonii.AAC.1